MIPNILPILGRIDIGYLLGEALNLSRRSVREVVRKASEILDLCSNWEPIRKFSRDIRTMLDMLAAYLDGEYTDVPWPTIALAAFALLYLLNPLDLVPDAIPFLGQLDDAAVLTIVLDSVRSELKKFRQFRRRRAA